MRVSSQVFLLCRRKPENKLQKIPVELFSSLNEKSIKSNQEKCYFLSKIKYSGSQRNVAVTIERKSNFELNLLLKIYEIRQAGKFKRSKGSTHM